ncbi:MAG: methyltransferase type 11 [Geobacteraceae bacterium GWC2_53_11]|nr:MAG: methyltransferase type 11 [Geobacteraceae bacterium GWC2_53_11]
MTRTAPFNEQTDEYDTWFEKHPELYQIELEALRSFIPPRGRGVEIGVGTGRFAAPLGIAIGVEPAPRMAELARHRGIEVLEGFAEALPFADESFDFAIMVTVICFLDDVSLAFREVCRILKPNGSLVIGFIDRESRLGQQCSEKKKQSRFYRGAKFYSAGEVETLLTGTGFSDFAYIQILFPEVTSNQSVKHGYGNGGFVVIQAHKTA